MSHSKLTPMETDELKPGHADHLHGGIGFDNTVNPLPTDSSSMSTVHFPENAAYAKLSPATDGLKVIQAPSDTAFAMLLTQSTTPSNRPPTSSLPWPLQWPLAFYPFTTSLAEHRVTCLLYAGLYIALIVCRNIGWVNYVLAGLTADSGLRAALGSRGSIGGCIAGILIACVRNYLPKSVGSRLQGVLPATEVAGAPIQFTWIVYTLYQLAMTLVIFLVTRDADPHRIAVAVMMGVMLGALVAECMGITWLSQLFSKVLTDSLHIVSDQWRHKYNVVMSEQQRAGATQNLTMKYSSPLVSVRVEQPSLQRAVQFKFPTEAILLKMQTPKALHTAYSFPALGVQGMASVWRSASTTLDTRDIIWQSLQVASAILYLAFIIAYIVRATKVPQQARRELLHPNLRFASFISVFMPILFVPSVAMSGYLTLAKVMYWIFSPLCMAYTLYIFSDLLQYPFSFIGAFNPAWAVTFVGLAIVATSTPAVYPTLPSLTWIYIGFGLFGYVVMYTFCTLRLLLGPPLPDFMRTTLLLSISAISLYFIAVVELEQVANPLAAPSDLANFLFFVAQGLTALYSVLLLRAWFFRGTFNIVWWASAFPAATFALSWLNYRKYFLHSPTIYGLTCMALCAACWIVATLGINTLLAFVEQRLVTIPPKLGGHSILKLHNASFRAALQQLTQLAGDIADNKSTTQRCDCSACSASESSEWTRVSALMQLRVLYAQLVSAYSSIDYARQTVVLPEIANMAPHLQLIDSIGRQLVQQQLQKVTQVLKSIDVTDDSSESTAAELQESVDQLCAVMFRHLDETDHVFEPLLNTYFDVEAGCQLGSKVWEAMERSDHSSWNELLPFTLNTLPLHAQRSALMWCYIWIRFNSLPQLARLTATGCTPFDYQRLCVDLPSLTSTRSEVRSVWW